MKNTKAKEFRELVLKELHDTAEKKTDFDYFKKEKDYKYAVEQVLNIAGNEDLNIAEIKEEVKDAEDRISEDADSLTDLYTSELLKWYLEDVDRVFYMDEAIKELGANDGFKVLSGGQFIYWQEILSEVIEACKRVIDKQDEKNK